MNRIKSFSVNHDTLDIGVYESRRDLDTITYDIRMKKPNGGDYLSPATIHTLEHLLATFLRNGEYGAQIIYVGPMGCRTGFYLITGDQMLREAVLIQLREVFRYVLLFSGEIPGSKREECGNYKEHDLDSAKAAAGVMIEVLENWSTEDMGYKILSKGDNDVEEVVYV